MKILVINSGSSSIKYQLFNMPSQEVLAKGIVEKIGIEGGAIKHLFKKNEEKKDDFLEEIISINIGDHKEGLEKINELLTDKQLGVIKDHNEIDIVGHRVLHGGDAFKETCLITPRVKDKIREYFPLGPLHNPANLMGIEVAENIFPKSFQVAVFDTAFHHSIEEHIYRYAIAEKFYKEHQIRVYGFHGISHKYVSSQGISYLNNPQAKLIVLHLGNGASITAIHKGRSIDTSMGLGPNQGLIMGTRSGDIDSAFIFHALNMGYDKEQLSVLLNKESGMLALCGSSDMRDVQEKYDKGEKKALLAYKMYAYRAKKYIGSYIAALNGIDALIFTGGIGENDALTRELICSDMDFFGISLDKEKNKIRNNQIREIQEGKVKIMIIPTDEEKQIAIESFELLSKEKAQL